MTTWTKLKAEGKYLGYLGEWLPEDAIGLDTKGDFQDGYEFANESLRNFVGGAIVVVMRGKNGGGVAILGKKLE